MNAAYARKIGLSDEEQDDIRREARLELARRCAADGDILGWGKALFPHKFDLPFCGLHEYLVETRHEPLQSTEAPRNHAKTTIECFLIPIYQALVEPTTFRHYLNVQATSRKAQAVNNAIKIELETNELLMELYGEQVGDEKWTEQQFVLRNGVIFTAIGAGESIRGLQYRNVRPDYCLADDLYDEDDINNPNSTQKKNDWFWSSLYKAMASGRRTVMHVTGTAINGYDLLEQLKKQGRWVCKTFQAITDWAARTVLWPALNTFESLEADREDMGSVIFMREMQNERLDQAESRIKAAWLTDWEYDPDKIVFDKHFLLREVLLGCDPSVGEKPGNDYTGMALILKCQYHDSANFTYLIENLWNQHLSMDARISLLQSIVDARRTAGKPPITRAYIESIAGFKDFGAEARRRVSLSVRIVDHVSNKLTTLENKSTHFENRRVLLNKNIDPKLKDMLRYQLTTNFPKNDDLRDGTLLPLEAPSKGPVVTFI